MKKPLLTLSLCTAILMPFIPFQNVLASTTPNSIKHNSPSSVQHTPIFAEFHQRNDMEKFNLALWNEYLIDPTRPQQKIQQMLAKALGMDPAEINIGTSNQTVDTTTQNMPEVDENDLKIYKKLLEAKKYDLGDGVKKDQSKANDLIYEATELGSSQALELLGIRFIHQIGHVGLQKNAIDYFSFFADEPSNADYPAAFWAYIAYSYAYGVGRPENQEKALQYWKKANHLYSMQIDPTGFIAYMMGKMIEDKNMNNQPIEDAMQYYKMSAHKDNIAAQQAVLKLLNSNKKFEDLTYEPELFMAEHKAAKKEKDAFYTLSQLYAQKEWKIYNPKKSIAYLNQAIALGHDRALLDLARYYEHGYLVKADPAKAAELYKKSLQQGNPTAGILLVNLYENGSKAFKADAKQAKIWRAKATALYKELGYGDVLPKADEIRLFQRMY
ncbi:tetratricopeptide repeat protein [Acinetobacter piscicola]|uniref:tetratricopeptide repeat protein n=1 Tax=Acinetobacter piscicola TaxID=2006115 RepID=UPI0010203B23|nr:tetratricopeptide repeat protein [Acinetobacter piscicola]RYL29451.1 sel1 repeat family protein [Acinetobacter piscicola]